MYDVCSVHFADYNSALKYGERNPRPAGDILMRRVLQNNFIEELSDIFDSVMCVPVE